MKFKKIIALAMAGVLATSMMACGSDADSVAQGENATKKIKIGTEAKYAPYEFKIMVDGKEEFAGFDMELAREISADLGVEYEIIDLPFDAIMLELQAGNIDMAIAGMSPSEERSKVSDFSDIYFAAEQSIVINKKDADKFEDQFSFDGYQVAGQTGSIQADYVTNNMTGARLVNLADIPTMINEVALGNVSAAVIEKPVVEALLENNKDIMILTSFIDDSKPGNVVVMPKNSDADLIDSVNATIKRVTESGQMDEFVANAFAIMDQEING